MDASTPAPVAPKAKRRGLSWLIKGPLGCLGFFAGLLLTLGLLTPFGLSRLVPGLVEGEVSESIEGSLEVEELRLGWLERQSLALRLLDPNGGEVGRVGVETPSLVDLGKGQGAHFGRTSLSFDIELVTNEQGVSNLDLALEPVPGSEVGTVNTSDSDDGIWDWQELLQHSGELEITTSRIAWEDRRRRGQRVVLEDIRGRARLMPDEEILLKLSARVAGSEPGVLNFELTLGEPDEVLEDGFSPALSVVAQALPIDLLDALLGLEGLAVEALGKQLSLEAQGSGVLRFDHKSEGTLSALLTGPGRRAELGLALDGHRVQVVPGAYATERQGHEDATIAWRLGSGLLERFVPEDASDRVDVRVTDSRPLRITPRQFELVLDEDFLARSSAERWPNWVEALELDLAVTLPEVAASGVMLDELGLSPGLTLLGMELKLLHAGRSGLRVVGDGRLDLGGDGAQPVVEFDLRGPAFDALGSEHAGGPLAPLNGSLQLLQIPATLADAVAGSGTLIADVLGPDFELHVLMLDVIGTDSGQLDLEFNSQRAYARLVGQLEGTSFRSGGLRMGLPQTGVAPPANLADAPSRVAFELGEEAVAGLISPLLPMLANVSSANKGTRSVLVLEEFALPIDGDLTQLSADLVLELGAVRLALLPVLAELPGLAGVGELQRRVDPLRLSIRNGQLRYNDLSLTIDGRPLAFDGLVDLAAQEFDLRTALPRDLFGGAFGEILEGAGGFLDTERLTEVRLQRKNGGSIELDAPGLGDVLEGNGLFGTVGAQAIEMARQRAQEELLELDLDGWREGLDGFELLEGLDFENMPGVQNIDGLGGLLEQLKRPKTPPPPEQPKGSKD